MHRSIAIIILSSMVAISSNVKAQPSVNLVGQQNTNKKTAKREKPQAMSLEAFIQKEIKEGEDYALGKQIGAALGYPEGAPTKTTEIAKENTKDHMNHECDIVIEKSTDTGTIRPISLILLNKKRDGHDSESHFFRLNLDGKLEMAFTTHIKYDDNDRPVPGSGVKIDVDLNAPGTKAALKHELDFWLKGMYRKKKAAGR